ncbi:MAG: NADH-quinone oxidoreductase subunit J [Polyangiaceae bacterium]
MPDVLSKHPIDVIVLGSLVVAALWAVLSPRLLRAVIALALASICVTALLFRLEAPLVGVFELSVCAGLISAVFISSISLSQLETEETIAKARRERIRRYWFLPLLLLFVGIAVGHMSPPTFTRVPAGGLEVRSVLWTERHLDLLGQVVILLAGAFGVVVFFKETKKHEP